MNKEIIQLKASDIKPLKEKWYSEQNGICPILKKEYPLEKFVVDHLHKLKSEEAGVYLFIDSILMFNKLYFVLIPFSKPTFSLSMNRIRVLYDGALSCCSIQNNFR